MATRVQRSIRVNRSYGDVAKFVSQPGEVLPRLQGFARYTLVEARPDGSEVWDMHTDVGSLHVGSRAEFTSPSDGLLVSRTQRGIDHELEFRVDPDGEGSVITVTFTLELPGLLFARISEVLARGIAARHLEAGLQQLRHYLEFDHAS